MTEKPEDKTEDAAPKVEEEWKEFSSDPTPHLTFSKEVIDDVDGEKVHIFLRLPNQWQHQKIRNHAQAAKARMVMQLRDKESDASLISEEQLEGMHDASEDDIIEWLLSKHVATTMLTAQLELEMLEDVDVNGKSYHPWENAVEQQEQYALMIERKETETEEFKVLEAFILRYAEALQARVNDLLEPKQEVYAALDKEGLIDKARRSVKNSLCMDEYINAYNQWQIYYGSRNPKNHNQLYFKNIHELLDSPSGLVDLLTDEFSKLDALKAAELGKSQRATSLLASLERYEI